MFGGGFGAGPGVAAGRQPLVNSDIPPEILAQLIQRIRASRGMPPMGEGGGGAGMQSMPVGSPQPAPQGGMQSMPVGIPQGPPPGMGGGMQARPMPVGGPPPSGPPMMQGSVGGGGPMQFGAQPSMQPAGIKQKVVENAISGPVDPMRQKFEQYMNARGQAPAGGRGPQLNAGPQPTPSGGRGPSISTGRGEVSGDTKRRVRRRKRGG